MCAVCGTEGVVVVAVFFWYPFKPEASYFRQTVCIYILATERAVMASHACCLVYKAQLDC